MIVWLVSVRIQKWKRQVVSQKFMEVAKIWTGTAAKLGGKWEIISYFHIQALTFVMSDRKLNKWGNAKSLV